MAPSCFAFKTSYPTSALHTSPSSLSQTWTSSTYLRHAKNYWQEPRTAPYTSPPSRKLSTDSLSPWFHLIIAFESYCWRYLWWVCSNLSSWAPSSSWQVPWSRWAIIFTHPSQILHGVLATVARPWQLVLWQFKLGVLWPQPYQQWKRWTHPSASPTPAPKEGGLTPETQWTGMGTDPKQHSPEPRGNMQLEKVGTS